MAPQTPPKQMGQRLAQVLRPERPDDYLTEAFRHTRTLLAVTPATRGKGLPTYLPIASWSRSTRPSGRPVTRRTWS
jgi:hypothetical protein